MGGFARRMTYWNEFAKRFPDRPALRLDGGSIFNNRVAEAPIVNRWTLEGTIRSNLDALNLSAWDLPVWQEMADLASVGQVPKEHLQVPLVSANVVAKVPNFPTFQRYIIKETSLPGAKTFRVGITGLLFDPDGKVPRTDFEIADPQEAAKKVVAELRDKSDYQVVLTDLNLGKAISLAIAAPAIDLILVSHNYEAVTEPQQVGDTFIVIPVNEGRMFIEARLELGATGGIKAQMRLVPLDRTVPDDPRMAELIRNAQAELDGFRAGRSPGQD